MLKVLNFLYTVSFDRIGGLDLFVKKSIFPLFQIGQVYHKYIKICHALLMNSAHNSEVSYSRMMGYVSEDSMDRFLDISEPFNLEISVA